MLSHVTIGTNDLARAKAFYDPVIATLGFARTSRSTGSSAMPRAPR